MATKKSEDAQGKPQRIANRVAYRFSYGMRHNDTRERDAITNGILKFRKVINI